MPPARPDPFTTSSTAAGHPSSRSLRAQPSHQSLSSNASAASTRTRPQRDLFAPALSRRPTSRTTPRASDDVRADSDEENHERERIVHRPRQALRRVRHGSPEGRLARARPKLQVEDADVVNRDATGNFLMKAPHGSKTPEWEETPEEHEANNMKQMDAYYASMARKYFASGAHLGTSTRSSRHDEPDFERDVGDMMFYLKDEVMRKLDDERWLYEPVDRLQPALS